MFYTDEVYSPWNMEISVLSISPVLLLLNLRLIGGTEIASSQRTAPRNDNATRNTTDKQCRINNKNNRKALKKWTKYRVIHSLPRLI